MSFITTFTGRHFSFTNMSSAGVHIDDIAHALSNICRFTGHLDDFYSVAQHSVLCSQLVPAELAFEALMHDASEAYLSDISAPLKVMLPDYRHMEKQVESLIRNKYGLPKVESAVVKRADLTMLATERRDFNLDDGTPWPILEGIQPASFEIVPVSPRQAKAMFLERYHALIPRRNNLMEDWT